LSQKEVIILGIESSCDDTSAAVLKNTAILFELLVKQITQEVLSNSNKNISEKIIKEFFNSNLVGYRCDVL
jgi:tRNA A37 threonylcarbamoyltransferase TsaD